MSFFTVDRLSAGYGGRPVFEEVSLTLERGCIMGILGANGSGKTTLLKALCGILPHDGTCSLDGTALEGLSPRQLARRCGYIPQRSGISIDIPALDVVLMGFNSTLGLLERPTRAMVESAAEALVRVGLAGKENTNYLHLSEGQKQLCILARALVSPADLLLLDEPESALDFRFRYRMFSLLESWSSAGGRSAVVALHDPGLALNRCHQVLLLAEGRVAGIIKPDADSTESMEAQLEILYGKVTLRRCCDRSGKEHLVMLREDEE